MLGRSQCLSLTAAFIVVFCIVGIHRYEEVREQIYEIKEEVEESKVGALGPKPILRASRATEEVMRVLRSQQAPQVPIAVPTAAPTIFFCKIFFYNSFYKK